MSAIQQNCVAQVSKVCVNWCPRKKYSLNLSPPAYEVRREVIFSVCLSVHIQGVPHLHPIILPLVLCSFSEGYLSDWSQVASQRGYPSLGQRGTPVPGGGGYHRTGPPSGQDWGTPPLARTGILPPARTGVPPLPFPQDRLHSGRYASCGFPQEDCLVNLEMHVVAKFIRCSICCTYRCLISI